MMECRNPISALFDADVRQRREIGPIFNRQIQNWPEHLEKIGDFRTSAKDGPAIIAGARGASPWMASLVLAGIGCTLLPLAPSSERMELVAFALLFSLAALASRQRRTDRCAQEED